jgi:hypothetical protein
VTQSPTIANASVALTHTMAIVSLVCAFGFWPLAIAFGHLARRRIATTGNGDRGLVTAGLVIGYTGLGLASVSLVSGVGVGAGIHPPPAAPATPLPQAPASSGFGDGVHTPGVDVAEGTYRTEDDDPVGRCRWELESNITDPSLAPDQSPMIVVRRAEGPFRTQGHCVWKRTGD